jgi:glutamate dehydrogenase (NAD(P)+)
MVVQGFGNVGSWAARIAHEQGTKVIAVSDVRGGILVGDGIDVEKLVEHVARTGSVVDFPGSEPVDNETLLTLPCDVLVPAALGEVVTHHNAEALSCRMIVEAANHPVTPMADAILADRGVHVLPDILANAGGVIVSYFEWVQNNQEISWEEDDVNARLERKLSLAWRQCRDFMAAGPAMTLREAAFALAVSRVVEAAELRGYL